MNSLDPRISVAGKYRLERPLATGGMGAIWRAWNTQLDVPVAVKLVSPALPASRAVLARFEREARAAAQIRSPHVVQIFEHGVHEGTPFIVMELLDGEDLGARMRRAGRLSLLDTTRIVREIARALQRAHAMGIVHRDLKPANVFLARAGDEEGEEIVKVLDFGIVKSLSEVVESGVTMIGEVVGTPHYMSPEQARGASSVDHRSDLWALGVIAYQALTGHGAFRGRARGRPGAARLVAPRAAADVDRAGPPPGDRPLLRARPRDRPGRAVPDGARAVRGAPHARGRAEVRR
jgi:serine/threonine-protein kinase